MMTDVLEHVPDDRALLASIIQACPEHTQIVLTVPADMRLWSPHDVAFGHYRRYDADSLAAVWDGLPVRTRLVSHFNTRLYPAVRAVRWINRRRGKTSGTANTDFKLPLAPINSALEKCFAGEGRHLIRAIDHRGNIYRRGVSLIAVLERDKDRKPVQLPPFIPAVLGQNSLNSVASTTSTPAAL
jgi:hypothetical protein